jgi:DNA relaxase NicK
MYGAILGRVNASGTRGVPQTESFWRRFGVLLKWMNMQVVINILVNYQENRLFGFQEAFSK